MASIIYSGEEHSEYHFEHVICMELRDLLVTWNYKHSTYVVAIDSFTDQIYALLVSKIGFGSLLICTV